ncbi:MAG: carboxypeptidase-like regulatory domain-containing protein [Candidatus Bathyarchaeota archaeon]|nr:carboxypeptidase-like regulatory domain-containing protein [Candidatus Bathyarchaeota archaeon]
MHTQTTIHCHEAHHTSALTPLQGEVIWRANGLVRGTDWGGRGFIGDSIIVKMDTYDLLIFALGKGPSATSVSASPKVSTHGSKVLVEGMVTDVSPGTKSPALAMRFPNGVPAVADESMSDWMLYVYKQFPRPADVKGVEVIVEVYDPNKNYYEVGRTTTDDSGFFRLTFEPPVPGEYTVIARFPGSKAYYGSFAKTAIYVEEAPLAPAATPTPASMTDTYVLGLGSAAIVAIVVIGLILILMLRKR